MPASELLDEPTMELVKLLRTERNAAGTLSVLFAIIARSLPTLIIALSLAVPTPNEIITGA